MRLRLPAIGMAIALIVGACGGTTASPSASGPPASSAASTAPSGAASPSAASGESILRVARLADHYNFWHPVEFQTGNQFQWFSSVFNTLVEAEADSKTVIGDLAETFDVSPDASVYTFHLVKNAKWHDGEAFTADDVMFTDQLDRPELGRLQGLPARTGSRSRAPTQSPGTTNTPEGLKKIDDSTVEMTLAAPNAGFLYSLTDMANMILPEHILKDVTKADVEKIDFTVGKPGVTIGTGPYKLTNFTRRPVGRARRQPRLLQGRAEDREDHLQALRRSGARRRPARDRATSTSPSASRPASSTACRRSPP